MKDIQHKVELVTSSDITVFITGETCTGNELWSTNYILKALEPTNWKINKDRENENLLGLNTKKCCSYFDLIINIVALKNNISSFYLLYFRKQVRFKYSNLS